MQKIVNYLNNPEKTFKDGLALYDSVKRDKRYDALFSSADHKPGSIAFNMLITELKNILRIKGVSTTIPAQKPGKANAPITAGKTPKGNANGGGVRIDSNPMVRVEMLPEDLRAKFERNQELTKLMAETHNLLQSEGLGDADAATAAEELVAMEEERDENWHAIDAWWNENRARLEGEKKIEPMTGADIGKAVKLLKDNINRASKDLDAQKPNVQANRRQRIAEWEKQIEDFMAQGKSLKDKPKGK